MDLFQPKKKKAEPLAILSEEEIQKKLYGNFQPNPIPRRKSQDKVPVQKEKGGEPERPQPSESGNLPGLFETNGKGPAQDQAQLRSLEHSKSKGTLADSHATVRYFESQAKVVDEQIRERKKVSPPRKAASEGMNFFWKSLSSVLQLLASAAIAVFQYFLQTVWGILRKVDLRKPSTRRLIYMAGAIFFIGLLILGVHVLNTQRERAMKNPPLLKKQEGQSSSLQVPSGLDTEIRSELGMSSKVTQPIEPSARNLSSKPELSLPSHKLQKPSTAGAAQKFFVVQVATYVNQQDAEQVAKAFQDSGFNAFIAALRRQGGRVYFCILFGKFQTSQEAVASLEAFRKHPVSKPFQDAFVRSLSN